MEAKAEKGKSKQLLCFSSASSLCESTAGSEERCEQLTNALLLLLSLCCKCNFASLPPDLQAATKSKTAPCLPTRELQELDLHVAFSPQHLHCRSFTPGTCSCFSLRFFTACKVQVSPLDTNVCANSCAPS